MSIINLTKPYIPIIEKKEHKYYYCNRLTKISALSYIVNPERNEIRN